MLPGGPLLPLTPTLPGMPAIVTFNPFHDDFRLFYQRDFVCSLRKTFGHLSDRTKKIEIDKVLILEHYTPKKVFVSPTSPPATKAAPACQDLQSSCHCIPSPTRGWCLFILGCICSDTLLTSLLSARARITLNLQRNAFNSRMAQTLRCAFFRRRMKGIRLICHYCLVLS
jgi:hypothetical protein